MLSLVAVASRQRAYRAKWQQKQLDHKMNCAGQNGKDQQQQSHDDESDRTRHQRGQNQE